MESIRQVPSRMYWFLSGILDLIILFFISIFKLKKPSDTLTREEISAMRRGNTQDSNGNDWRYRGSRGSTRMYMGG